MTIDAPERQDLPVPGSRPSAWARIAGGVGVATDVRKLILAALGLVLLGAGWGALGLLFRGGAVYGPPTRPVLPVDLRAPTPTRDSAGLLLGQVARQVAEPAGALMRPFADLFATGGEAGWGAFLHALLASIWAALVWGIVGGAIARIAVVQVATGQTIGLATAWRFALRRARPLVGAPLSALLGAAIPALPCGLIGLALYRLPGPIGPSIGGVLLFVPLLLGLVMALILLGLAAGWPLMILTVVAEDEDTADALSRSYAYTFQRPIRYASFVLVAWAVGVLGLLVIGTFAHAVVHLAEWGLALGAPAGRLHRLFEGNPAPADSTPAAIHGGWLALVNLVATGWAYAYFWTTASEIYLLLRRDVDGTPFHAVYQPEHEADTFAPEPEPEPGPTTTPPDDPGTPREARRESPVVPRVPPIGPEPSPLGEPPPSIEPGPAAVGPEVPPGASAQTS